jgi:hypothetical protein
MATTKVGVSARTGSGGPMGNPWLAPDGSVANGSPSTATSTVAALEAQGKRDRAAYAWAEDRLPRHVQPRDQARATGAEDPERYGETGQMTTAYPLPKSSAQLMNASGARRTG